MAAPEQCGSGQRGGLRQAFGIVAALVLSLPFAYSLEALWQSHPSAAVVPAIFAGGIVVCSALAWFQGGEKYNPITWRHGFLLCAFICCGAAVWLDVPYGAAITVLIAVSFAVIGRRGWPVMLAVWIGSLLLAYGVFRGVLGIPVY